MIELLDLPEVVDTVAGDLDRDGVAVVPDVLDRTEVAGILERLWAAAGESERRGVPTYIPGLDPNAANVRVFDLIELDPLFGDLICHPVADAIVERVLGPDYIISNFTANIARPGSGSMMAHSDQGIVMPEPWLEPQTLNVVWCLTDVHPDNGATLHLPGSHRFPRSADVPEDPIRHMVPFRATAGSIIVIEGRIWHTSGRNITEHEDRALLFGYYTKPFVRPQWNFTAALSPARQAEQSPTMRYRLGLDIALNVGRAPTTA